MKVVEEANYKEYLFTCINCGASLKARGSEFDFLKPGRLECTCPSCGDRIAVKERHIEILPVYVEYQGN